MKYSRAKLIQLLHIAKHRLNIDEIKYRQMLFNTCAKTSAKDLNTIELMKALEQMERLGFRHIAGISFSKALKKWQLKGAPLADEDLKAKYIQEITQLWGDLYRLKVISCNTIQSLNLWIRQVFKMCKSSNESIPFTIDAISIKQGKALIKMLTALKEKTLKA